MVDRRSDGNDVGMMNRWWTVEFVSTSFPRPIFTSFPPLPRSCLVFHAFIPSRPTQDHPHILVWYVSTTLREPRLTWQCRYSQQLWFVFFSSILNSFLPTCHHLVVLSTLLTVFVPTRSASIAVAIIQAASSLVNTNPPFPTVFSHPLTPSSRLNPHESKSCGFVAKACRSDTN